MDTVVKNSPVDNLEVTGVNPIKDGATIAQAGVIPAGAVLGKVTASGKLVICDTTATDGSEVPFAVNYQEVDTTDGDEEAVIYLQGSFNEDALTFGGATVLADVYTEMRKLNLMAFAVTVIA